jgi:hypothetical protein
MRLVIWIAALLAFVQFAPSAHALDPNNCGTPAEPKACGPSSATHSTHKTHTTTKRVVHRPT